MAELRAEFSVHLLNAGGLEKAGLLAVAFSELLSKVDALVPSCRERSLVVTKLQEACFFAKRGIALEQVNQLEPASVGQKL